MALLTQNDLTQQQAHYLLEEVEPGAPLVLAFGFYQATGGDAAFNFYGRLKKLEQLTGRPLNKLLLRDPAQAWYLGGIAGLGNDVPATVVALRHIIDALKPSAVITLGQSMGGYAALLYGLLVRADRIISFGPLSCFDRTLWALMQDRRWQVPLEQVEARYPEAAAYQDLIPLLRSYPGPLPEIDIFYGTSPGSGISRQEATGADVAHAIRFAEFPSIHLLPSHRSGHAIVEYFRQHGVITQILAQRLFGHSLIECMAGAHPALAPWDTWTEENLRLNVAETDIHRVLVDRQFTAEQAHEMIERVYLRTSLTLLEQHPPHRII